MQSELERQHERHKNFLADIAVAATRVIPKPKRQPHLHTPRLVAPMPELEPAAIITESPAHYEDAWHQSVCGSDAPRPVDKLFPTVKAIQHEVCKQFDIPMKYLLGPSREARATRPRFVGFYLCRQLTPHSLLFIGKRFFRDHTCVINGLQRLLVRMQNDPDLAAQVEMLRAKFMEPE